MNFSKKMQQLFAILLVAVMVVSVLPAGTLSVFATVGEFAGGDGTAENPYLIASKTQLNNVRNYLDAHFKMIADIEFDDADFEEGGDFYNDGAGFEPIGATYESSFTGTFDGDGHVIKNIYVNIKSSSSNVYAGLFGSNEGTIKNLGMVNGNITASSSSSYSADAGGIAGYNRKGTIQNCYNTGSVSASSSSSSKAYDRAGGIAGVNDYYGTIENCYNTGSVSASSSDADYAFAGGIAGYNRSTITNCYNTGSVSASCDSDAVAGGVAGYNGGTTQNCYNTGDVSASSSSFSAYAGGIAGFNDEGTVKNCYYLDNISIGVNGSTDTATKCTDEQLKNQETFVGFDFETVWTIENNTNYPYPVLKDNPMILIGMGDINSDGKLDSTDYLLIKRAAFGTYTFTEAMTFAGDINSNGSVDSADYLLVKRACFGTYKI